MSLIEKLLQNNKNFILNSKYQNTIYNNIPLYEYFNEIKKSNKSSPLLDDLLKYLISQTIPCYDYFSLIKYRNKLEQYSNLYIRYNNDYDYIKLIDFYNYFDKELNDEYPIHYYHPTFFSRSYKLMIYNKKTNCKNILYVNKNDKRLIKLRKLFISYKDILNLNINIDSYKKINLG